MSFRGRVFWTNEWAGGLQLRGTYWTLGLVTYIAARSHITSCTSQRPDPRGLSLGRDLPSVLVEGGSNGQLSH